MLASSAFVQLGEQTDPSGRGVPLNLDQVRYMIDLLAVLQGKTAGNRTPEESQLLETILYDLRMRFVQTVQEQ
jgi:hypothetical protein